MILRLDAIKFNHDPSSASVDAFNIRKNDSVFVEAPEWRRGVNINPEDSPAAYSLFDTRGNTLTIQASFSCEDRRVGKVNIRALDGRLYPKDVGEYIGSGLVADLLRPFLFDSTGNVLGEVEARNLEVANGTTGYKTFNLKNVRIWDTGVGVQDIVWRWQYRIPPYGPWTDFAKSTHRIYTTLSKPREPWQQSPFESSNIQLPWAAVLDYACRWAATAQNPTDAATRITRCVYQLGKDGIAGYCPETQYTDGYTNVFKCAAFLFDLKLGTLKLNCTDCATIVSTFANILGSELWQSSMTGFDYNPIIRIGESQWRPSHFDFHIPLHFDFHTVAWEEDCDVHNDVFDACLQIDGDGDPTAADPDHVALLPTDLRFGRPNDGLYRQRLVAPVNLPNAATPLRVRRRRLIQGSPVREESMLSQELLDQAAQRFDLKQQTDAPTEDALFPVGALPTIVLDGWTELRSERLTTTEHGVISESLWRSSAGEENALLLMNIYVGASIRAARRVLLHSIAALHSSEGVERKQVDFANAFFILGECSVTFSLSNVVVSLVNAGNNKISLSANALTVLRKVADSLV